MSMKQNLRLLINRLVIRKKSDWHNLPYTHNQNVSAQYGTDLHNFVWIGYFPKKTLHILPLHFLR